MGGEVFRVLAHAQGTTGHSLVEPSGAFWTRLAPKSDDLAGYCLDMVHIMFTKVHPELVTFMLATAIRAVRESRALPSEG